MTVIPSHEIPQPRIEVSPPLWIWLIGCALWAGLLVLLLALPLGNGLTRIVPIGIWGVVTILVARNKLRGDFLVTMQANAHGLYFQTPEPRRYFHVPWRDVGRMEKAVYPLNSRGLRFEITGQSVERIESTGGVAEIRTEDGRTFVYTIPQLHDRDDLLRRLSGLKAAAKG